MYRVEGRSIVGFQLRITLPSFLHGAFILGLFVYKQVLRCVGILLKLHLVPFCQDYKQTAPPCRVEPPEALNNPKLSTLETRNPRNPRNPENPRYPRSPRNPKPLSSSAFLQALRFSLERRRKERLCTGGFGVEALYNSAQKAFAFHSGVGLGFRV